MLVLSRRQHDEIVIYTSNGPITIKVNKIKGGTTVNIGVDAPSEVLIVRGELCGEAA